MRTLTKSVLALLLLILLGVAGTIAWQFRAVDDPLADRPPPPFTRELSARGAYLARAANCAGCHTAPGGAPYAGGRAIDTPFGAMHASNITPDDETGLGRWTAADFWRALHHGRSKDGRLLYPSFPYTAYTRMPREDADALFAYLKGLPPVKQANRPHDLRFPYDTQVALAAWRTLYFRPGVHEPDPARPADWNRGAYLVRGPGHCVACHGTRNGLGATTGPVEFGGGPMPGGGWHAPSLHDPAEGAVIGWKVEEIVALLGAGINDRASVAGPMAEVVHGSTQHLVPSDLRAMAVFLQSLPPVSVPATARGGIEADPTRLARGAKLHETHCAACHGDAGQGVPGIYPPLAGNRALIMQSSANAIRAVLLGGFPPSTAGNPRPYGMPPFAAVLDDADIAAVLSYARASWGNRASAVAPHEVDRQRRGR